MNNDVVWLKQMAEDEDYGFISAGGLYARRLDEQQQEMKQSNKNSCVLGQLVELARRRKGMSPLDLSKAAQVGLSEVLEVLSGQATEPKPRVLFMLSQALDLPAEGLMELGGLMESRDKHLEEAVVRFAAQSKPTAKLSRSEKEALEEFVKVLARHSDRGRCSDK